MCVARCRAEVQRCTSRAHSSTASRFDADVPSLSSSASIVIARPSTSWCTWCAH
jgi:hypothetical protein